MIGSVDGVLRGMRSVSLDDHVAAILDTALAIVDAAVIVSDGAGRVELWNAGAERLFGWAPGEVAGELVRDLIVPSNRVDDAAEIRRALAGGRPWSGQFLCRRRDGELLPVDVTDVPMFDDRGALVAVVAVCTDVTDRLVAERDERALRAMADASSDAVFTVSDGRIVSWSPAAHRLLGWLSDEIVGRDIDVLVPPHRRSESAGILAMVQSGTAVRGVRTERLTRGGSPLPVEITIAPVRDDSVGGHIGVVTMRDLRSRDQVLALAHAAEARFHALLASSSELVVVVDADGFVRSTGPSSDGLAPTAEQPTAGRHVGDLVHPDDRCVVEDAHERARSGHESHVMAVYRRVTPDGEIRWREAVLTNMLDDEMIAGIVYNVRDVTEREEALDRLRANEARFRAVVNRSSDVAVFFEKDGTIGWVSPAVREVFGLDPDALIGLSGYDLVHPADRNAVAKQMAQSLQHAGDHVVVEYRTTDPAGRERWVEDVATNLLDDPDVGYIVANLRDVTARRAADEELRRVATFDELTGLANRTRLLELLEDELGEDAGARCGLLFFDLDDFCDVNDALGHRLGDELLVGIAGRIDRMLAGRAVLARFGGDQFAILYPDIEALGGCLTVADDVRRAFEAPFVVEGREVFAAVSQGVATGPVSDGATLVSWADTALYRAKRSGRAQIVVFETAHGDQTAQRLHFVGEIRRAIERDEIVPWYQPVVDLATGHVVAVEALARWNHPELGQVPPDSFIPVAESTGLIGELGASILRHACRDAVSWEHSGHPLHLAVNASAVQLVDPAFRPHVEAALSESGLAADRLSIEITETAALRDFDAAMVTLVGLRDRGIGLSLDDFGTGYSPLTFLKQLPADALKIDRSFVDGLGRDHDDDRIVTGVIQLGLALGFRVVAEGVETPDQAVRLGRLGCQFGQGFLWSPAVRSDDLCSTIDRIEAMTTT
jgi:diguanylate cyclase (GGDEF)-like protein/PAS domain S-box-containing protein